MLPIQTSIVMMIGSQFMEFVDWGKSS
jgi:hypothetical protein